MKEGKIVTQNQEIAVVGAGIVGATTAFYLAKKGYSVTIYDEGTGQATAAAAGIICPWLSQRRNKKWYHLAASGAKFYPELMTDLGESLTDSAIYQQVGTLLFKKNEKLLLKLEKLAKERRETAPEIGDLTIVASDQLHDYVPILNSSQAALFASGGARVDGELLTRKLIEQAVELGATFQQGKVALTIDAENQLFVQSKKYAQVVLAVGAWLPELLEPLGFTVDIRPQKGQLLCLDIPEETTNWPVVMPDGEKDIIPFNNGKIIVGATHENDKGYDLTPTAPELKLMLAEASELAPSLKQAIQVSTKVGTRAYTSDFSPFFGQVSECPQLYVASGLGSSGLTTGPIIGKMLAQAIHQEETELDFADYPVADYVVDRENK